MTTTYTCLDFHFTVEATDPTLQRLVDDIYAPCRGSAEPETRFTLVVRPGASVAAILVFAGDSRVTSTSDPSVALASLVWAISQRAIAASTGSQLLLHAAAAEREHRAVLLPAASGSGKSTLVAGLVGAGWRYLTDDICAIDPDMLRARPYPKPISVATHLLPLLEHVDGWVAQPEEYRPYMRDESFLSCFGLGGHVGSTSVPRLVVVPEYVAGANTEVVQLSRAEALVILGEQSFNFNDFGAGALDLLARVLLDCTCFRLRYSQLADAVNVITDLALARRLEGQ